MNGPTLFGDLTRPASAVLFSGLGGACEGIHQATGVSPLAAINHWPYALQIHALNHPGTWHYPEDVFNVPPSLAARGRSLQLLWMSPDCTDHSRAKGGKPKNNGRRSLADVVFVWFDAGVLPAVLMLENVPEFRDWGPLHPDDHPDPRLRGQPDKARRGELFRAWVRRVESYGYKVEHRVLAACDYGAPTIRKRLYLVARRDGLPIAWPLPTHGPGRPTPWRTAAECIDWSIPGRSIFGRKKPLAEATQRRIAAGLVKYVLTTARPFVLCHTHGGRLEPIDGPLRTITTAKGGERGIVTPYLVQVGQGERRGQAPRVMDLHKPLTTVVASGQKHGLVTAWLAKHYGGVVGQAVDRPLGTVTTQDHHALCTANLSPVEEAGARRVEAFITTYYGQSIGQSLHAPLATVPTVDRFGLVTVTLEGVPYVVVDVAMRMLQPRELARAQGFPESYRLDGTIRDQTAAIGNSVCPPVARALVEANLGEMQ